MVVLELHLVDVVAVREHLSNVEELERALRAALLVGHFQNPLEVQRHDGDAIQRGLLDLGLTCTLRPSGAKARDAGGCGSTHQKLSTLHGDSSFITEGLRPSDSPTRALARRFAGALPPPREALRRDLAEASHGLTRMRFHSVVHLSRASPLPKSG